LLIDRRLQLDVLRSFQQIAAILNEQVQAVDDVANVFEVGVFVGQAGEGFEQVGGSAGRWCAADCVS